MVVLTIGVLGTLSLLQNANGTASVNGARVGAVNLARELTEYGRGTDYDNLQPSRVVAALRDNPALTGTGPSPWTVQRRGVVYTVTATVCTFDDPKDGLAKATEEPANPCPPAAADPAVTRSDPNPDDFRRLMVRLDWTTRGRPNSMTQAALIVNPAGGLGPRITRFDEPTGDITTDSVSWGSGLRLTTTSAAGVHWNVDDGASEGDATGGPFAWGFTWSLGTRKLSPLIVDGTWVLDGNYVVQTQATDSRGVPGEARAAIVRVNRHPPAAVTGLEGGYNARFAAVDLRWSRYPERDVLGYRVYRGTALACPSDGSAYVKATTCTDTSPCLPGTTQSYTVVALDCQVLATCAALREGAPSTVRSVQLAAGVPLPPPAPVTATVVDGLPKLDWTSVPGARFYRIYRDSGTELKDRYDETITSSPTYTDPDPGGTTQHTYWVTAVDSSFNESVPSPPVTSPAGT